MTTLQACIQCVSWASCKFQVSIGGTYRQQQEAELGSKQTVAVCAKCIHAGFRTVLQQHCWNSSGAFLQEALRQAGPLCGGWF